MSAPVKNDETPLMKQYYAIKAKHPDAILLFRVGDFYETFEDDARRSSAILGITLTKRANGAASYVDLAGFPYHALDTYLPKLVRAGLRVAICEQLEDPKLTKTIVKRGITELVTPGVALNDQILENKENNFLASVFIDKKYFGLALLDISTGEFLLSQGDADYIDKLLQSFRPKEVLYERQFKDQFVEQFGSKYTIFPLDEWVFTQENANERLLNHFKVKNLKGFGVHEMVHGVIAAGAILNYLNITEHRNIGHISSLSRIDRDQYVWLDKFTVRNLELLMPMSEGGKSLLDILDRTTSPMGGRLLRRWIAMPLVNRQKINDRHDVVECFITDSDLSDKLKSCISSTGDLERLISKVAALRVNPREMVQLRQSLLAATNAKSLCEKSGNAILKRIADQINPCTDICNRLGRELQEDAPNLIAKGKVIAAGVSAELDELRSITTSGKDYLLSMQEREIENTGISSLRIGFNNVFGYYFEVRNTHKDKVPAGWMRKQTLVSAERYITEELKEYESKILGAEEKIIGIETRLFNDLVLSMGDYISTIQLNANLIAQLDCLISYATVAIQNHYCRPSMNDSLIVDIKEGRHPVIEKLLLPGDVYITNDVYLDPEVQQMMMITGPNMSGKSALLRQTALICLMAQAGSYVPVLSASLGIIDKIFTRVGASDNISMGESTFMVEMNEAASILNNLSDRSLVLLDEIGRGTSTYDGVSIAWAIAEFIHENPRARAKTLFATHYHELNEMEKTFSRIRNYNVSVKESGGRVLFMRKLKPGGSEHSFGIHVAEMAGMPRSVVERAKQILVQLEGSRDQTHISKPTEKIAKSREGFQLSFFQLEDPVLKQIRDEIKNLDINGLTPLEALNKLNEIKKLSGL
ncbi:MAG: DNA mismatch repair protein MutS [Bacteroidales bacterium]|nr:DNA mismatch repair protein MutS [Bacteroidales bacterium]HOY37774.1 DNA mismatch repair protein MutS [Bacteroidales bacterium]HQP02963.1 DNA mismatch repair protein MutS [Bacteroidales bacterium]